MRRSDIITQPSSFFSFTLSLSFSLFCRNDADEIVIIMEQLIPHALTNRDVYPSICSTFPLEIPEQMRPESDLFLFASPCCCCFCCCCCCCSCCYCYFKQRRCKQIIRLFWDSDFEFSIRRRWISCARFPLVYYSAPMDSGWCAFLFNWRQFEYYSNQMQWRTDSQWKNPGQDRKFASKKVIRMRVRLNSIESK